MTESCSSASGKSQKLLPAKNFCTQPLPNKIKVPKADFEVGNGIRDAYDPASLRRYLSQGHKLDLYDFQPNNHQSLIADKVSSSFQAKAPHGMNILLDIKNVTDNNQATNPSVLEITPQHSNNLSLNQAVASSQYILPENEMRNILGSANLNINHVHSKTSMSKQKNEVTLPKIDDNEFSKSSLQEKDKVSQQDFKMSSSAKRKSKNSPLLKSSKLKSVPVQESSKKSEKKIPDYHHEQVIMPLSYIGKSFLNSDKCSDGSKFLFQEIADLGQRAKGDAILYLPSIIGSLCKRVVELEKAKVHNLN